MSWTKAEGTVKGGTKVIDRRIRICARSPSTAEDDVGDALGEIVQIAVAASRSAFSLAHLD